MAMNEPAFPLEGESPVAIYPLELGSGLAQVHGQFALHGVVPPISSHPLPPKTTPTTARPPEWTWIMLDSDLLLALAPMAVERFEQGGVCVLFPVSREFCLGDRFAMTISSASESCLWGVISRWGRIADIPAG